MTDTRSLLWWTIGTTAAIWIVYGGVAWLSRWRERFDLIGAAQAWTWAEVINRTGQRLAIAWGAIWGAIGLRALWMLITH